MKEKIKLTISNGNSVSESIESGRSKPFLGTDYQTEKKATEYANKNNSYVDDLYQNGRQVGFVVLK